MSPAAKRKRTARDVRASRVRARRQEAPVRLRMSLLLAIWACGAAATAMGVMIVEKRFEAQDLRMETSRLQDVTRVRRDEIRELEVRIADLTRGESLRQAALGPLRMIEPPANMVGDLKISETQIDAFREATDEASRDIAAERARLDHFSKEVF